MTSSLIDIDITGEGPMGINLSPINRVVSLAPGGLGDAAGVRVGDTIVRVSEASIEGKEHPEVLALIKAAGRPLRLTFLRAAPVSAARTAAATAGNLFKGFLGAAVQGIKGIDSIVGSTIDGSVRQATVRCCSLIAARDPFRVTLHLTLPPLSAPLQAVASLAGRNVRQISQSDALVNFRSLLPRDAARSVELEKDLASPGLSALMHANEERLESIRMGNDGNLRLCVAPHDSPRIRCCRSPARLHFPLFIRAE